MPQPYRPKEAPTLRIDDLLKRPEIAIQMGNIAANWALVESSCIFHVIPVTHSTASRSLIPRHRGQRFHGIPVSF